MSRIYLSAVVYDYETALAAMRREAFCNLDTFGTWVLWPLADRERFNAALDRAEQAREMLGAAN